MKGSPLGKNDAAQSRANYDLYVEVSIPQSENLSDSRCLCGARVKDVLYQVTVEMPAGHADEMIV